MIDKKQEQEYEARLKARSDLKRQEEASKLASIKRIESFSGTRATLTKDNKIILSHTTESDFDSATKYLLWKAKKDGMDKFTKELNKSVTDLICDLFEQVGEKYCQKIVRNNFYKKEL